jgi:hypothetical protein
MGILYAEQQNRAEEYNISRAAAETGGIEI